MRRAPDPYFPGHGDTRYRVRHYDLELRYKVVTNRLDAVARLRVEAIEECPDLRIDLSGLNLGRVLVDGQRPAAYRQAGRTITVRPAAPLPPGAEAVVEIGYSGKPRGVPGPFGPAGWEELADGVLVASQPYGAPSWFPCNDFAGDKAPYRIAITCEAGYLALANGVCVETGRHGADVRRVYEQREPMAPYQAVLQIGRYVRRPLGTGELVAVPSFDPSGTPFARVPAMLAQAAEWFGPYPFQQPYTCLVTPDELEIPLEAQGLASFGSNHAADHWDNERLIVHELAHQWFGNAVTAGLARDIWLHEGFACYTEWLWSQARGLDSTDARARHAHVQLRRSPVTWPLTDPGVHAMFDDEVYKRGALTLHALRRRVGDATFFAIVRGWCAQSNGAVVTTADFVAHAQRCTPLDLEPVWRAWLYSPQLPPLD